MEKPILFRAVIEVLGKPKEHVEEAFQSYIKDLKADKRYKIVTEDYAEIKKQEQEEMWSTFAELEIKAAKLDDLIFFCFNYMPSMIEIVEPSELMVSDVDFSKVLNDLQAKLHHLGIITKQMKAENEFLHRNMGALLKNYVHLLLSKEKMNSERLSRFTGLAKDKMEDFLDQLIDKGEIDLEEGLYSLKKKEA